VDVGAAIAQLRPDAVVERDYSVADNALTHWDEATLGPRPTEQQLRDAWLPALKAQKVAEMHRAFEAECKRDFGSPWLAIVEVPPGLRTKAMKLRDLEKRIAAATTEEEIRAVKW
jgi:hypothetical protein